MSFVMCLQVLPLSTDIKSVYSKGSDDEQKFIQNLAMFLASYLKEHVQIVEKAAELHEQLGNTLRYVTLISQVSTKFTTSK